VEVIVRIHLNMHERARTSTWRSAVARRP
jgi:hypothetical protein